jgi:hypothetical protein
MKNITTFILLFLFSLLSGKDQFSTAEQLQKWNSHWFYAKEMTDQQLIELSRQTYDCYLVPHTHWDKE